MWHPIILLYEPSRRTRTDKKKKKTAPARKTVSLFARSVGSSKDCQQIPVLIQLFLRTAGAME